MPDFKQMPVKRTELFLVANLAGMAIVVTVAVWFNLLVPVLILTVAALLATLLMAALWRNPGSLLLIYVVALPVYFLSLAVLYQSTGSRTLISVIQPWKEVLAVLAIALVLLAIGLRFKIPTTVHRLDILVAAFLILNVVYLAMPSPADMVTRLYAVRANAFFTLIYLLGRAIPLNSRIQRWIFVALILIGASAGVMAIAERLVLSPTWPVQLGYSTYLKDFFGQDPRGNYGLSWTFETESGLRRASAFFANPLELASSSLLTGMAALYAMFHFNQRTVGRWAAALCWLLIAASVLLSISRASTAAFVIQSFVAALVLRRTRFAALLAALGVAGFVFVALFAGPQLTEFVARTLTFENASSQGHLLEWAEGLTAVLREPLGLGLGTSGPLGARSGIQVGGENQYIIAAVQLGFLGLVLYIALSLGAIIYALRAYRRTVGITAALAFVAGMSRFGLLFPAFTANIDSYLFVSFVSWWLVGFSVQVLVKQNQPSRLRELGAAVEGI